MSKFKLSLAVAVAATSFSALDAKPLEEAIRGVDISGSVRYRYDTFRSKTWENGTATKAGDPTQEHEFRANLSTKLFVGDGFSIVGTLDYNTDGDVDAGYNTKDDQLNSVGARTKLPIYLREAYLRYDSRPEFATAITLGRQQLNTIWTDNDNIGGSAGMKAQLINTALPGATLTAFAVDSVDDDGDFIGAGASKYNATDGKFDEFDEADATTAFGGGYNTLKDAIFNENLYGAAAIFDYSESVGITGSIWFSHVVNRASFYAVDLGYTLGLGDAGSWNIQAQYLGNSPVAYLKSDEFKALALVEMAGGNLYTIQTGIEVAGFDANLGFTSYGKKDKLTVNVLEDMGDIITAGEELQNLDSMSLHGSVGQNNIVFGGLGYTIAEQFRIGVDYAWARSKIASTNDDTKQTNQEVVGRLEYAFRDDLNFSAFYSYINSKTKGASDADTQQNIRFEARYDF